MLLSRLETLRERADETSARHSRSHKQPAVTFNPAQVTVRPTGRRLDAMDTLAARHDKTAFAKGNATVQASLFDDGVTSDSTMDEFVPPVKFDASGTPDNIMSNTGELLKPEPVKAFANECRHTSRPRLQSREDTFSAEITAALECVNLTELDQLAGAEQQTQSHLDSHLACHRWHVGRGSSDNSWCLEQMVQMMERQNDEAGSLDLLEILEAMQEDDGEEALHGSVLPILGTSRGRLPTVAELALDRAS
jgi:hypothetical protein